jgi:hypothetical protein
MGRSYADVAKVYNVTPDFIRRIGSYETWKDIHV